MDMTRSEDITIETEGAPFTGYFAQSEASTPRILLLHAWWGLTPVFKDLSRRLANAGFTVFAPDYYEGRTAASIQEAEALSKQRDLKRQTVIVTTALKWLQSQPSKVPGLGLIGFSMGGAWALDLSSDFPDVVKAVVLFYAGGDTDFSKIRARYQGHFGGKDEWTPPSDAEYVENKFRENGVRYEFFTYPDAPHWFIEPNRPEYRERDAVLAWERTLKFFKNELKG